jgi:hypothetical protein
MSPESARTAHAILADVLPRRWEAQLLHLQFLRDVVSSLPAEEWRIDPEQIWDWYLMGVVIHQAAPEFLRSKGVI